MKEIKEIYRDKFIQVLYDNKEVTVLYGQHVNHFSINILEDIIKLGLLLENYLGSKKRATITDTLLELWYEEEIHSQLRNEVDTKLI